MKFSHKKQPVLSISDKIIYSLLLGISLGLISRYAMWWFDPAHIPTNYLLNDTLSTIINILLFTALSFVVFIGLIVRGASWYAAWFMARPLEEKPMPGLKVAFLTCYVPGKEPIYMLRHTLQAMLAVDYPHDTWVLDEGGSEEVQMLCEELGVNYFTRSKSRRFNRYIGPYKKRTKAGNLNSWRHKYEDSYDIVAQVDMDHIPKKNFLTKTLGYFNDSHVGFVGMPQVYKNSENWISRGASEQAHFFYGPIQQGFYGKDMTFLIGTSHIYRTEAMKDANGYSPTIAEDHLTGLHFHSRGWKSVYVPEILAEGDGPLSWADYFGQQMRWSYGLFEILFKHSPRLLFKLSHKHRLHYFLSQIFYFTGVSYLIGSILTIVYLLFGISSTSMFFSEWIIYSLPPFVMGYIIQFFLHQFQLNPKEEPRIGLLGILLGIGANMIYAIAFVNFILGKKLNYKVTTKGVDSTIRVSGLNTFLPHILLSVLMIMSLVISVRNGYDSPVIQFWAIANIISTFVILGSNYYHVVRKSILTVRDFLLEPFIFSIPRIEQK